MDLRERLASAREGIAFGPPLRRGLLRLTGKHRLSFLHRIATQKLAELKPGETAYTAFLEVKGRVVAEGLVVPRADDLVLDVDAAAAAPLAAHLRKYVMMDDVKVHELPEDQRVVLLLGPRGVALASELAEPGASWPDPRRGAPARALLLPESGWGPLRSLVLEKAPGAAELSESDLEVLRVEAGIARYGAEMDETRLVIETGAVPAAVAFDKGCYLGQEVVARGTFRGMVQRGLVQLDLPAAAGPGSLLRSGGQEVGNVTSAVDAPGGRVGLGYLRRNWWTEGTRLATDGGEAVVRRAYVTT